MRKFGIVAALTGLVWAQNANAVVYDLGGDWIDGINPNGPWVLRHGTTALPYEPDWFPSSCSVPQPGFAAGNSAGNHIPIWAKAACDDGNDLLTGDVFVHATDPFSGSGNGVANAAWVSPISGTVDISGQIWSASANNGRTNSWRISKNDDFAGGGQVLLSGTLTESGSGDRASPEVFSSASLIGVPVIAGDIITLVVEHIDTSLPLGQAGGNTNGVVFTIDATAEVPLPPSAMVASIGVIALGAVARFRKRSTTKSLQTS